MEDEDTRRREAYKKRCAANDLLGLSSAVALLMKGIESRFHEDELEGTLAEEQEERLKGLFMELHRAAEDVADLAREIVEQST